VISSETGSLSAKPAILRPQEVHVWKADLDMLAGWHEHAEQLLSAAEGERARQYVHVARAQEFIVARAMLRTLLGLHLQVRPEAVHLETDSRGKPRLGAGQVNSGLQFNLSHSRGSIACAVTRGRRVGVDVEYRRTGIDVERLAGRFFAPAEFQQLMGLPQAQRHEAFFAGWTRKEAFLKACGQGLTGGLSRFVVQLRPGEDAALLSCDDPAEAARWRLAALEWDPGYAAAVCAEVPLWELRQGVWDPRTCSALS
jgi:4'-phosphopantetheinyl transferase